MVGYTIGYIESTIYPCFPEKTGYETGACYDSEEKVNYIWKPKLIDRFFYLHVQDFKTNGSHFISEEDGVALITNEYDPHRKIDGIIATNYKNIFLSKDKYRFKELNDVNNKI